MADSSTPNLGLILPEVGASRDSWGTKTNANWTEVDRRIFAQTPVGAGMDFYGGTLPLGWLICAGQAISRATYVKLFGVLGTAYGAGDGSTTFNLPNMSGLAAVGTGGQPDSNGDNWTFALGQKLGSYQVFLLQGHLPNISVGLSGDHVHPAWTDVTGSHLHGANTDQQGAHDHTLDRALVGGTDIVWVAEGGNFTWTLQGDIKTNNTGAHGHNVTISAAGEHQHVVTIGAAGAHQHPLGGSGASHPNMPPIMAVVKMIFTGVI